MRMSCDSIDLRLRLGNASADRDRHSSTLRFCRAEQKEERQQQQQQQGNRQITIFYNGQICTRNVTELQVCGSLFFFPPRYGYLTFNLQRFICLRLEIKQAREIICMATREMDDQTRKESSQPKEKESSLHHCSSVRLPLFVEQQLLINPKLSMKRSLQRFLQKRKSRSLAISPYYMHTSKPLFSIKS